MRLHPNVVNLPFKENIKFQDKINAQIQYIECDMSQIEYNRWLELFNNIPEFLLDTQKREYLDKINSVCLASDAFFPFRDSIDQSSLVGVQYISQPGGSIADKGVIEACNDYNMLMTFTGIRSFHH